MLMLPPRKPDLKAEITVLSSAEGGRNTLAYNGIRWDFRYQEDNPDSIFMIWPYFVDHTGKLIINGEPIEGTKHALMYILNDELIEHHKSRMEIGSRFHCVEGQRIVANGEIKEIYI